MDFGDKVRAMREARGLSTTELAKMAELSQSFISDIENKRRTSPRGTTISKLAKALRVPTSYFLEDDTRTPLDILKDTEITNELREYILDRDIMPYLKVNEKAAKYGISPEKIDDFINLLIKHMNSNE